VLVPLADALQRVRSRQPAYVLSLFLRVRRSPRCTGVKIGKGPNRPGKKQIVTFTKNKRLADDEVRLQEPGHRGVAKRLLARLGLPILACMENTCQDQCHLVRS
jgi:hypothetical protein